MYPWLMALLIILAASEAMGESIATPNIEHAIWKRPGCHKLGHSKKVVIPGCAPFSVTTNACRGFCESWAFPSAGKAPQPVTSLARCCSIMDSEDIKVKIPCVEGERSITFKSAITCACYHCRKA